MENDITLIKNNDNKNWSDLEWTKEFYEFLQGNVPEDLSFAKGHGIKLSKKKAFAIIYYLQEHFPVIPDHIEQCSVCGQLYDSWSQGHHSDLTGKFYCGEGCEPYNLYEREEKWEKRKDAPFRKWLRAVKKEQNYYALFMEKEINESWLRQKFNEKKTPAEALNDLSTVT